MWFYWYWYEHVAIGLATCAVMYSVKYHLLGGEDILLSLISYIRGKR